MGGLEEIENSFHTYDGCQLNPIVSRRGCEELLEEVVGGEGEIRSPNHLFIPNSDMKREILDAAPVMAEVTKFCCILPDGAVEAAGGIQRWWRRVMEKPVNGGGAQGEKSRKGQAKLQAARMLQFVFRGKRLLSGVISVLLALTIIFWLCGRTPDTTCNRGKNLATEAEFARMRELSDECLDWYAVYPSLLRRLRSGVTPCVVQNFCVWGGCK